MEIIPEKIVDVNKDIENHQIGCIYDKALAKLKIKLGDLAIHSKSMSLIIKYVLEIIEATPIKGSKQKDMALKLMRAVIVDLSDGEDKRVLTQLLDDGTISDLIELVIDATKGKLDVNVAVKIASGCFTSFIPYVVKKVKLLKKKER
tara:strand:- start:144 stop:584 length:441 start_codon:yes stop_codon:yes gene_type:complete